MGFGAEMRDFVAGFKVGSDFMERRDEFNRREKLARDKMDSDDLFRDVPAQFRFPKLDLFPPMSEMEALRHHDWITKKLPQHLPSLAAEWHE